MKTPTGASPHLLNPQHKAHIPFTPDDIELMLVNLDKFTPEEQHELHVVLSEHEEKAAIEAARDDLIAFCQYMEPGYKVGRHHRILADLLMDIESGQEVQNSPLYAGFEEDKLAKAIRDRVCVNVPPRHGKSHLVSTYFPAWALGRNPKWKVMMVSHTTDLAVDFGRKVRNLVNSPLFRNVFPDVAVASDSKSAGRWNTNHGGEYFACGVGSALAGRGADLLIIDDPHSEQDVIGGNYDVFDKAYEWFTYGARTRLMPGGRIAIIQTRWHQDDLTGRVCRDMAQEPLADQYEVVEFPAILEIEREVVEDKNGEVSFEIVEKPLWPEFFDLKALHRTRASMPLFQWNSQYQQNPTAEEGAIVKRDWWKIWQKESPPTCVYKIMSLDTAAETKTRADFTAITTWGVFKDDDELYKIILLNSIKERYEFPELKEKAATEYNEWEPDAFIVEKKSSGVALFQELRRTGMIVQEYTPHRGTGDKHARLASIADIIKSGLVYVPQTRWAEELVEEVAGFPFMSHDDLVDSTIMAMMRFRQGGFIRLPSDEDEPTKYFGKQKRGYYL